MNKVLKFRYRILALLVLAVVLSAATYGFAAANTFDESRAGEGDGLISGYHVSGITYVLDSSNPSAFYSVTFTLDNNASQVYVGLGSDSTIDWNLNLCTGGPLTFTCDLTGNAVTVAAAKALHVASAQ